MQDRRRVAALGLVAGLGILAVLTNAAPLRPPPDYSPRITVDMLTREHTHPAVLLIGDDFAAASSGVPSTQTFPWRACATLQWICNVDARPGTGYQAGGQGGRNGQQDGAQDGHRAEPYGKRVPSLREVYLADVVVVTGGLNDGTRAGEYEAARRLFHDLTTAYPHAEHVAVEPFSPAGPGERPPSDVVTLRAAVQKAASEEGFRWVDTDGWLVGARLTDGGGNLTRAGHEAVGARLAGALRPLGVGGSAGRP